MYIYIASDLNQPLHASQNTVTYNDTQNNLCMVFPGSSIFAEVWPSCPCTGHVVFGTLNRLQHMKLRLTTTQKVAWKGKTSPNDQVRVFPKQSDL